MPVPVGAGAPVPIDRYLQAAQTANTILPASFIHELLAGWVEQFET